MDKVDVLTKLNPDERERYADFMRTAKGMPTGRFAFAMSRLTPGTNWRGCSKSYIAAEWAKCESCYGNTRLRHVTLEKLAKAMEEVQKRYA